MVINNSRPSLHNLKTKAKANKTNKQKQKTDQYVYGESFVYTHQGSLISTVVPNGAGQKRAYWVWERKGPCIGVHIERESNMQDREMENKVYIDERERKKAVHEESTYLPVSKEWMLMDV